MPITLPVQERIAEELFFRLQFLASGYDPDVPVSEVVRPTRLGSWTPQHMQIVLTAADAEVNPELQCPGNPPAVAWNVTFNIRCHLLPSESDTTPIDRYKLLMVAAVHKVVQDTALLTFTYPWHTFNDLALDSRWQTPEQIDADGGVDGINVPLLVIYRTDETNPYNVR